MKKSVQLLTSAFAFALSAMSAQCTFYPAPPGGMVASYYFNNNLVETIANSSAGNTNNNVAYATDRFGNASSALDFNNTILTNALTKEFVSLNNPGIFSGDFTVMYWFKADSTQINRRLYLFSIDSAGVSGNLNIELNDNGAVWAYWNGQGLPGFWSGAYNQYNDDLWHFAVLRRSGTLVELFIDMVLMGTYSQSGLMGTNNNSNGGKIVLGYDNAIPPSPFPSTYFEGMGFNGQIDDLSLYNVALTTNVISNYYNNYDLAGWFTFSGSVADSSGCGNNAFLANTTGNGIDVPTPTSNRFGTGNSAYHFNGNGLIKIEPFVNNPVIGCSDFFSNDFSVSFWSKTAADNKRQYAFSVDRSTGWPTANNFGIEFNDSDFPSPGFWTYWNGMGLPGITEGAMNKYSDSLWHFVTVTRNVASGWITAYIDADTVGTYQDLSSVTIGSDTDTMDVGHYRGSYGVNYLGFDHGFVGDLDEFKFHRHTLSYAEISSAYTDANTAYRSAGIHKAPEGKTELAIYPNPSSATFHIKSPAPLGRIVIMDVMGKTVMSVNATSKLAEVDMAHAKAGIYFMSVYNTEGALLSTQKIIKE